MEEQDIPIDINSGKLLDWLINRRHCQKDWQTHVLKIREKINNAIQDMPAHQEIAQLLSGTHINYFHCKKIVEILKETEADTKNLFGRYGSQRMKDWQEIVHLYEKDNVYLAEAAQMLIRNINYEVPGIKKLIQKLEQTKNELGKKKADYKKSENIAKSEFNNLCKQLGISGVRIKRELTERIVELPEIYDKIARSVKSLDKVVEFYDAFVEYTLGAKHNGGCVPLLKYLIEKGNTTTYEWTYGEAPLSINEPSLNFNVDDDVGNNEKNDTIDFGPVEVDGIDFNNLDLDGQIDFGDDIQLENAEGAIDWGGIADDEVFVPADDINFEIALEESGIVVEADGNDGGNASGSQAWTILDNPETRTEFVDQLMELEAFLKLRLYEFKSDSTQNLLSMSNMQESSLLQMATLDSTQNMLDNVQVVLSEMLDNKAQHLYNIKHSPRYVDVLASNLKQKQMLVEKMESLQKLTHNKQEEIKQQALDLQPMLKLIVQKTKELQSEIESDISKRYKNRKVQLTGGIHTL
ncbi:CDK5RAP3-like protein [Copidosoma floridanum]|uniref:CDK5RAP3-like protein n=1 Tax=Copidosoma floridanum TaxID=29053 RepID=UPI0006C954DF|nr:CDK5RAP3-like protein [Copidosoma floridanum]